MFLYRHEWFNSDLRVVVLYPLLPRGSLQVVAFILDIWVDRSMGVCVLNDLLQQSAVHNVCDVCAVLRLHGAPVAWTFVPDRLHRLLLVPMVHTEDLLFHQGTCHAKIRSHTKQVVS